MTYRIREVRAYSTKQRPNPVQFHGPYETREAALEASRDMARKSERNDNRSSYMIEEGAV